MFRKLTKINRSRDNIRWFDIRRRTKFALKLLCGRKGRCTMESGGHFIACTVAPSSHSNKTKECSESFISLRTIVGECASPLQASLCLIDNTIFGHVFITLIYPNSCLKTSGLKSTCRFHFQPEGWFRFLKIYSAMKTFKTQKNL